MQPFVLALMFLIGMWPVTQPQSEWRVFTSQEGRFSATMPGQVQETMMPIGTREGTLMTHIISTNDKDLNEFLVSWTEYPHDSIEKRGTEKNFDRMRDALVSHKNGTLLRESADNYQNYPARVITFSVENDRIVKVRFCFVKNRIYQVLTETRKADSGAAEKFFDSFTLLPGYPV